MDGQRLRVVTRRRALHGMTRFSNGSAKVFCAPGEGAARTMPADRTDSEGFLRFLEAVRRNCGKFVMVLDNASYHDSGPVREGVEKMESAGMIFLPPSPCVALPLLTPGALWHADRRRRACAVPVLGSCPRSSDAPRWRPCPLWPPRRMPYGPVRRFWPRGPLWIARPDDPVARVRLRPSGRPACGSRQARLGQPAAKKHGTASAGLMREYGMRLEKTRKSLPAVARLRAGRGSRAGLQADSQTSGSSLPPPPVDGVAATASLSVVEVCRRRRGWCTVLPHPGCWE